MLFVATFTDDSGAGKVKVFESKESADAWLLKMHKAAFPDCDICDVEDDEKDKTRIARARKEHFREHAEYGTFMAKVWKVKEIEK